MRHRSPLLAAAVLLAAVAVPAGAQGPASDTLGRSTLEQTIVGGPQVDGFGPLSRGAGEPHRVRTELASADPGRQARRRSLLYFAQLTDFQLSDEESPARVEFLDPSADQGSPFGAAFRPQEALVAHMTEMAVRQVNQFVPASPVAGAAGRRARMDFAITTGDSADSQQRNETEAVVRLLEGGTVNPNSGSADPALYTGLCAGVPGGPETTPRYTGVQDYDDGFAGGSAFWDPDDPRGQYRAFPRWPGLMDQAQQPFRATGLAVPSYVTFGNHDALVQGNQAANPAFDDIARGCVKPVPPSPSAGLADTPAKAEALLGTGGARLVPPDPGRGFISKPEYKALHAQGKDGHGFALADPAELRASRGAAGYYAWSPKPGFRFVAIDTVSEGGVAGPSANGNLDDPQFRWIRRTLQAAQGAGELVVLFGHHPPRSLTSTVPDEVAGPCSAGEDPRPGCDLDPRDSRPVHGGEDLRALLLGFPNVIALVSGHTHEHRATPVARPGGGGFWEVETAAEIDFPHQNRLLEVMDNGDGTLSLFGTVLDHAGPIAAPPGGTDARTMGVEELASVGRLVGYNDPQSSQTVSSGNGGEQPAEAPGPGGSGRPADRNVELLLRDPRAPGGRAPSAAACAGEGGLLAASATPRGRGARLAFRRGVRRPVQVDVFQHSAGRRILGERLVARFTRRGSFSWSGRANRRGRVVRDGTYSVRFTMRMADGRRDVRRVVLERRRGRFVRRPAHDVRRPCGIVKAAKLERPVFGGVTDRPLRVAVRLARESRLVVRVLGPGRRVLARREVPRAQPGRYVRVRFDARRLRRGPYRVEVDAVAPTADERLTLGARRA